ncbi:uncharacterized protein si:dkeyp-97a10.3 isoform X2 [Electrophorus electricus]|uniref:uncharacterized protein si:dkeyp-97a10.3 isoform X2 n=1 Tax=Electrophorus electricus TaxID=8005 RepID=UPI0015D0BE1D|nr:uncharacterized protein si:dkeyp-97a10.3 isoform X2 [Electrophorus electricus]
MNILLHPAVGVVLTVLPWTTAPQGPVPIQFQVSPVQVASGRNAIFVLQTITDTFSISWLSPGGSTLGLWIGGHAELNPVPQYQGRIFITATQLTISACQLIDAGNYTVNVIPSAATGLTTSSLSVTLNVFDAVTQVNLTVPSVAIEGRNVSLLCTWATGSNTSVAWSKGGSSLPSDPHIIINAGSLILSPASRSDAGLYSCTVSNPVSAQTATATLTVYYGPDTPQVTKTSLGCVGGGDATVGQTIQLACMSVSLPPAKLSWQYGSMPLTTSQTDGGTLNLQVFSTNQSGQYVCMAHNGITMGMSQQQLTVTVVVDQRLRDVTGVQKTNLNNNPPVLAASPNRIVTSGMPRNGDQPAPPRHGQHNSSAFPQSGRENPDILIQTGHTEPGAHTVLMNLSSLAHEQQHSSTVQPRTLHVNLSTSHPSPGQPDQNPRHYNQQSNMCQQAYPNVQTRTENTGNTAQSASERALGNGAQEPSNLVRTDRSYPNNQGLDRHINDPAYAQSVPRHRRQNRRRSRSPDPALGSSTHLRQMPWDNLMGTPAYPNAQVDELDSSEHPSPTLRGRPSRSDPQRMRSAQTPRWRSPEDKHMRTASQDPGGQFQRQEAQHHSRTDLNVPRQSTQPNINSQVPTDCQNPTIQAHGTQARAVPQNHTTHTRTAQHIHMIGQTRQDERHAIPYTVNIPHTVPLTQAALELHTSQTPSPLASRIQQTPVVLPTPRPNHSHPTAQLNRQGRRPPTPPPVLRPAAFQTLPRKHLEQSHMAQPARKPDVHRHMGDHHGNPQRRPGNHHVHASRNPPHMNQQFHRSRPRL